ncbi:MAG: MFS transporter [Candidatus Thorarchaeota archaeon]
MNNLSENNFFRKSIRFVVAQLYLNDRSRLSPILLGILGAFSSIIFMSYIGLHLEDLKTIAWLITFILALRNLYQIFLRVPLGHFSQIVGRKPLLVTGVSLYTVSLFFMSIATHWGFVLVAVTFFAIGMSCFWPNIFAYIGDIEEENIGRLQGRVFQGTDIGSVIGALLAVLLLKKFQTEIRVLFAWGAGISLIGVIGLALFIPEVLPKEDRLQIESKIKAFGEAFLTMFRSLIQVTRQKKLNFIYVLQIFIAFLEYMVVAFFPFLVVSKGYTDDVVAQVFWISAGVLLFFKPYMGRLVDKIGYKIPIFFTLLFSSTMLILMVFIDALPWLIIVYMLYSASSLTSYLGANTGTTRESKIAERGMALGALGFYVSCSRSISTVSMLPIWNKFGVDWVFITTSIIVVVGLALIYLVYYLIRNKKNNKISTDLENER